MYLFLLDEDGQSSDALALACLRLYAEEEQIDIEGARIERSEAGKPFIPGPFGVHLSISHSAGTWACLFADEEAGLDIQEVKDTCFMDIADRFFTDPEKEYVAANGEDAFFSVWVRKEAASKCLGTALMDVIGKLDVADAAGPLDTICTRGRTLRLREAEIDGGKNEMRCAVCVSSAGGPPEEIKLRDLRHG